MHKQRLGVLIAATVGILTTFLPWLSAPELGTISPYQNNEWNTFILFAIPIGVCLTGNLLQPLSKLKFYGAVVPSALAVIYGIYQIWSTNSFNSFMREINGGNSYFDDSITLEFGIYFMVLAGISLIIIAFKTKENNLLSKVTIKT